MSDTQTNPALNQSGSTCRRLEIEIALFVTSLIAVASVIASMVVTGVVLPAVFLIGGAGVVSWWLCGRTAKASGQSRHAMVRQIVRSWFRGMTNTVRFLRRLPLTWLTPVSANDEDYGASGDQPVIGVGRLVVPQVKRQHRPKKRRR